MGGAENVVLCVGNQVPVKGVDVLIDAWEQVRSRCPGARLCLVGDGPLRGRLERTCRARGYGSSVVFVGGRPHDEVPLWMNAADCLCLPSRSEGMPNVVLEALASGLPAVANRHPVLEWMTGGGGLCTDLAAPGALADALASLTPGRIAELGAAAREQALRRFDRDVVIGEYEAYYRRVLSGAEAGRRT